MAARTRVPSATIGYERLRVVGKGSFGLAVLYRRLDDDSLVILKQVDLHNLTGAERQLCLNEVSLLSRLDHPHIITYFDSFEEEGVLTIEMEYAEGGTLAQYLAGRECGMEESEIMIMFEQMLSAVLYLHGKNVLHRDLKTANIFLTRLNDIKLGDFGISKAMGTETQAIGASTVVGTPYYISPEMCEGKSYNEKSDIWALGCILYEMAQLQKTFEGTNLPALVNKIMKGQYEQLRGAYSNELKLLIRDMLRKEPESRPSARQALEAVQKRRSVVLRRARADQEISSDTDDRLNKNYSALYFLNVSNMSLSPVNTLPPKLRIRQVAISECHRVVVTSEKLVYSWGDNRHGQLGLGDRRTRSGPCLVEALTGKSISKLAVGSRFSLFCADSGIVMVCGHRRFTGTGKYNEDLLRPRLMESLLSVDIVDISCGEEHAAALGEGGQVFVWGNGANGRLGTGNIEHVLIAVQIETIPIRQISAVFCGSDATALLLIDSATILAMGSNRNNKLSLNRRQGFFTSSRAATGEVLDVLQPTSLKSFPSRVIDVRLGRYHSGVLLESGHIHMFGSNESGELGLGHRQVVPCGGGHRPVKTLTSTAWLMFECGDGFTLAASTDNELYFWGSRGPVQDRKDHGLTLLEDLETAIPKQDETIPTATKPSVESNNLSDLSASRTASILSALQWKKAARQVQLPMEEITFSPSVVLRLDTSLTADGTRTFIRLASIRCSGSQVVVVIDTSMPSSLSDNNRRIKPYPFLVRRVHLDSFYRPYPVRGGKNIPSKTKKTIKQENIEEAEEEEDEEDQLMESWIRRELDQAEILPLGTSKKNNKSHARNIKSTTRSSNNQQPSTSRIISEKKLQAEIEQLKVQMSEQRNTFQGQADQMLQLQSKLAELQAIQQTLTEKHMNNSSSSSLQLVVKKEKDRPKVQKNTLFKQNKSIPSRVCTIL